MSLTVSQILLFFRISYQKEQQIDCFHPELCTTTTSEDPVTISNDYANDVTIPV